MIPQVRRTLTRIVEAAEVAARLSERPVRTGSAVTTLRLESVAGGSSLLRLFAPRTRAHPQAGPQSVSGPPSGLGKVRFDLRPGPREIHRTALAHDSRVLLQFPEVQRLESFDQGDLARIWEPHKRWVAHLEETTWRGETRYVTDPQSVTVEALRRAGTEVSERLIRLHYQILVSLAGEQRLRFSIGPKMGETNVLFRIRAEGEESLPIRRGVREVPLGPIDKAIGHYDASVGPLEPAARLRAREALVQMEVVRPNLRLSRDKVPRGAQERLFPEVEPRERRLFGLLDRLVTLEDAHFEPFADSIPKTVEELFARAGRSFDLTRNQMIELTQGMELPPIRRGSKALRLLENAVALVRLLRLPNPKVLLAPLYEEEILWAGQRRPSDLEGLARGGFGAILTRARAVRNWKLRDLEERSSRLSDHRVHETDLIDYGNNTTRPGLGELRAIVTALNEHPEAEPVDRAEALFATYPSLMVLRGSLGPWPPPVQRTVRLPVQGEEGGLDPKGLPHLLLTTRTGLQLTVDQAAERLGRTARHIHPLEKEPGQGADPRRVPGRELILSVTAPSRYNLSREEVLQAHTHTFWREDPLVDRIRGRSSIPGPVLIDFEAAARLPSYAKFDFETPGEMILWWMMSENEAVRAGEIEFLSTTQAVARFLIVNVDTLKRVLACRLIPRGVEVDRMVHRMRLSRRQEKRFRSGIDRMKVELPDRLPPFPDTDWLAPFPGALRLVTLARLRPKTTSTIVASLRDRLGFLRDHAPDALAAIDQAGAALSDPTGDEVAQLVTKVHRIAARLTKR